MALKLGNLALSRASRVVTCVIQSPQSDKYMKLIQTECSIETRNFIRLVNYSKLLEWSIPSDYTECTIYPSALFFAAGVP